jgi:hypothetical protein
VIIGVGHDPQLIFPVSLAAQRIELMLFDNVRGKAVRINFSISFGVRQNVDFAVRLFERLPDFVLFQKLAPGENFFRRRMKRMPELDLRIVKKGRFAFVSVDQSSVKPNGGRRFVKTPDQTTR